MRGRELPLVLLALVLFQAPRGRAVPLPAGGGTVLTKMYPRGNHWAVGHLMGKKSTGESSVSERGSLKQQLREYIRWEEAASNLLGLIEAKENRNHQPPQPKALGNQQPSWDSEDSSNFKDVGSKGKVGRLSAPGSQREGRNPPAEPAMTMMASLKGEKQNP
ncbi:gastrin-releasing peptide isoform X2 [Macaca nemestrina]|uniref:Gastrin-releasing peptide n=4 Tax=Macaca TaxID=9539 RepID=F6SRX2_MACMU|nr:gastrin-releasing peptide isoform X1 [Macaca nemestrina]XP_011827081.1 PREDICTED: gastrin-releasing peptide isoform X1 [Mandrillus leucophaeus]XP_014977595.1 gastrin-releasing peptide isoform X1 [Macaca mulatta]XP_045233816.1 gastrin-releasing peptide isoform X3 [Macaca fascicularis]